MTSIQKSSGDAMPASRYSNIESLAGVFHPHAIEVQDFSHYSQIIDLRSQAEYENDHIPGALWVEPPDGIGSDEVTAPTEQFLLPLAAVGQRSRLSRPLLLYCGDAGRVSRRAADLLRGRGMAVDVLPGGWINYRRWVQAGLELLPRLITFAVIRSALDVESAKVLDALREAGRQVLDLRRLAETGRSSPATTSLQQPPQAWFESQLLQELRRFDPRLPVWTHDVGLRYGGSAIPGALRDAFAVAPSSVLQFDAVGKPPLTDTLESSE